MIKFNIYLNRNATEWDFSQDPTDLVMDTPAAQIEASGLEDVYGLTQNIGGNWAEGEAVVMRGPRSTMIGDLVEDQETGRVYVVARYGFEDVTDQVTKPNAYARCHVCHGRGGRKVETPQGTAEVCPTCYKGFVAGLKAAGFNGSV
jgi:hypothetical protein